MSAILEILLSLLDFLSLPLDLRDLRAKRRREMEELDRCLESPERRPAPPGDKSPGYEQRPLKGT
ncbi:MAG TPA: hypothetical protein VIA62_23775 [Thermoanaerobaculia bacterium]|jgi:hypothetical protein|nr:hypothetical protein [Thermoanaerobaculia bacterium]